jgi:hypothetical protein
LCCRTTILLLPLPTSAYTHPINQN